jgi:hypothetical protein
MMPRQVDLWTFWVLGVLSATRLRARRIPSASLPPLQHLDPGAGGDSSEARRQVVQVEPRRELLRSEKLWGDRGIDRPKWLATQEPFLLIIKGSKYGADAPRRAYPIFGRDGSAEQVAILDQEVLIGLDRLLVTAALFLPVLAPPVGFAESVVLGVGLIAGDP